MGRDREIEKELIKKLASAVKNRDFIISSLRLMDDDAKRIELIEFLNKHPKATKNEIEVKMFHMSIAS